MVIACTHTYSDMWMKAQNPNFTGLLLQGNPAELVQPSMWRSLFAFSLVSQLNWLGVYQQPHLNQHKIWLFIVFACLVGTIVNYVCELRPFSLQEPNIISLWVLYVQRFLQCKISGSKRKGAEKQLELRFWHALDHDIEDVAEEFFHFYSVLKQSEEILHFHIGPILSWQSSRIGLPMLDSQHGVHKFQDW